MAAPKGNEFWKLRSKHGRDKLFATPELLWDAACEYFQWCEDNPFKEELAFHSQGVVTKDSISKMRAFTIEGLCHYLDCNKGYFNDFSDALKEKDNQESKDFSVIVTRMREIIYRQKFEGAASGFLNPNIIARDLGLIDKKEFDNKGSIKFENVSKQFPDKD
jgi:hypothetical protein